MVDLSAIVDFLERELMVSAIADYPAAINGLQLANGGKVARIVAAVDASLPVVAAAAVGDPALLVVHHGMFWQGAQPVTGAIYQKIKLAIDAELAIYSSHLPLDVHPQWGNNVLLAKAIGLADIQPFFEHKGQAAGVRGHWTGNRDELTKKLQQVLGGRVHQCAAGPDAPCEVGIVTGGAGSEVAAVAACGVDTFITGEGPHWSYTLAEEIGINLFYGGHYATETFGVRAIAEQLSTVFGIPWSFIDHPTGL